MGMAGSGDDMAPLGPSGSRERGNDYPLQAEVCGEAPDNPLWSGGTGNHQNTLGQDCVAEDDVGAGEPPTPKVISCASQHRRAGARHGGFSGPIYIEFTDANGSCRVQGRCRLPMAVYAFY